MAGVNPSRDRLEALSRAAGAPGAEDEVRACMVESLQGCGQLEYDRLGSVLCERAGAAEAPRVVLDSHLDEVGFMVQSITAHGLLRFLPLGGWWGHVLLAQRVDVVTESGKVSGVITSTPPHFLSADQRRSVLSLEQMYIDIGASSAAEVEAFGVRLGDPVVPHAEFAPLANPEFLSGKAFDNRVGVGIVCEVMRALDGVEHPNTVIGVGAVQEEVGCRGAQTSSAMSRPDVAIVLEGTPADDGPGFTEPQAVLGGGPQIRLYDPTAISNRRLVRFVEKVAAETGHPCQLAVRRSGGTDASSIQRSHAGVPTVVIGVPARYIHTHVSVIHWQDYVNSVRLTLEVVRRLDATTVASLVDFSRPA